MMIHVGIFKSLFGRNNSSDGSGFGGESFPECGSPLVADGGPDDQGTERFECSNRQCYGVFFRENGGPLLSPFERHSGGSGDCENCQSPLTGGDLTVPWEDGDNPYAYVTCPRCGHHNIKYGFGGD